MRHPAWPLNKKYMTKDKSPVPSEVPATAQSDFFPICPGCAMQVKNIRHMDYGTIRVVFHDGPGCIIGVIKAE